MTITFVGWPDPPSRVVASYKEVHVWDANVDALACLHERSDVLAEDERQRAARFHFERDRCRYIRTRTLVRCILGHYIGIAAHQIAFTYGRYGKPDLAPSTNAAVENSVRFNLAHCGGRVLCVVTDRREVGVDLERLRPVPDVEQIAAQCFSSDEFEALHSLPTDAQTLAFFRCWTRKEAYVKARGVGLNWPLNKFAVTLTPHVPAQLLYIAGDPVEAQRWSLCELTPSSDYIGALAVEGYAWRLICWRCPESFVRTGDW
jgi:4'-phosphopantetheinyl transferase